MEFNDVTYRNMDGFFLEEHGYHEKAHPKVGDDSKPISLELHAQLVGSCQQQL